LLGQGEGRRIRKLAVAEGIFACRIAGHLARRTGRQDAAEYGSQDGCRYPHRQLGDALGEGTPLVCCQPAPSEVSEILCGYGFRYFGQPLYL